MAIVNSFQRSTPITLTLSKELSSSRRQVSLVQSSVDTISKTIERNTKIKRDLVFRSSLLESRRREASKRREMEDALEASRVTTAPGKGLSIAQSSGRSPLGRILTFLGFLGAGWILENLPTWIAMGKEFIGRVRLAIDIMSGFVGNVWGVLKSFGGLLKSVGQNIITLDLTDTSDRIKNSFEELNNTMETLGSQIEDGFKALMAPLGIEIPGLSEERQDSTERPESPASGGAGGGGGQLLPIHQQALDIISGPESGGDYNAMNNGQAGDRPGGSKRWLGKNLTDMTIGEVKRHQTVDKDLWAAGRYQFVPNTLPGVAAAAGLKDSDMFNKQNQDLMAATLLKQRGIQPWTVGGSKYSQKELSIVEQARRTPFGSPQSQSSSGSTQSSGGGKIVQYLHGEPGRAGYEPKQHWNHDHYSFTTRAAAVKAFLALKSKGFQPYEFEGYGRKMPPGSHSATGGHFGPVGGKPTYDNENDGVAFDIPYSSYGSGPIGPNDYKKSREAYKIVAASIGQGGGSQDVESQPATPPAQISSTPSSSSPGSEITPERRGPEIVLLDESRPSSNGMASGISSPPSSGSSGGVSQVIKYDMLNNFIKNKLLLDLAYL